MKTQDFDAVALYAVSKVQFLSFNFAAKVQVRKARKNKKRPLYLFSSTPIKKNFEQQTINSKAQNAVYQIIKKSIWMILLKLRTGMYKNL